MAAVMRPGDLTLSGKLFVGCDFDEWETRVDAVLRIGDCHYAQYSEAQGAGFKHVAWMSDAWRKATSLISSMISPALLERVPGIDMCHPFPLWNLLEKLSGPFRFVDLLPELRNRIYICCLARTNRYLSIHSPRPALALTCRQLATEFLPMCVAHREYKYNDFVFACDDTGVLRLQQNIKKFAKTLGTHSKHLRSLRLWFRRQKPVKRRHRIATFNFSLAADQKTLRITTDRTVGWPRLTLESEIRLSEHVTWVMEQREILASQGIHMQGELIIFAILSRPELWKSGTLAWAP